MISTPRERAARAVAFAAGAMDFLTGLGLVAAPALTLMLMRATVPGVEALVLVRFVGVFVAAVGASYLWIAARGAARELRTLFEVTLFFRGGAGIFTGVAVATGSFGPAWLSVTATDLALVAVQLWWLRQGLGRDE